MESGAAEVVERHCYYCYYKNEMRSGLIMQKVKHLRADMRTAKAIAIVAFVRIVDLFDGQRLAGTRVS